MSSAVSALAVPLGECGDDPLDYLPSSTVVRFSKGEIIYDQAKPSTYLYLIISGRVKTSRVDARGLISTIEFYGTEELFGETGLIKDENRREACVAVHTTIAICWSADEIERLSMEQPKLALAMVRFVLRRNAEYTRRIESFSLDLIDRRLVRLLIRLSERFGARQADGWVSLDPINHEVLSQCVGSSRKAAARCMKKLRKDGHVTYSLKQLTVHHESLKEWLSGSVGRVDAN